MLKRIGVATVDDLYADIPEEVVFKGEYALPEGMSEINCAVLQGTRCQNRRLTVFAGGAHAITILLGDSPSSGRSEFYTAYTPYQPERSRRVLSVHFRYPGMISGAHGHGSPANASMYDGATATAEVMFMMVAFFVRKTVCLCLHYQRACARGGAHYTHGSMAWSLPRFLNATA